MITQKPGNYTLDAFGEERAMNPFLVLAFLLPMLAQAGTLTLEEFQQKMKKHMAALSSKTSASVQIEVLGKGTELFAANAAEKLIPASNAKLITTAIALERLGPGYSFETKVVREGNDLVLVGNGDPYLVSERLYLLARDVARSGIKEVNSIRVNNSAFSGNYRGLMDWDNSGEPFTAMVSATSLNFNSLEAHVIPSATGERPRVELGPLPHAYATVKNEARLVNGSRRDLALRATKTNGDKETFVLTGTIGRAAAPAIVYGSVSQPESYIAHVFAALLRKEGIAVKQDFGGLSAAPKEAKAVATLEGPPLVDLVRLYNTYSNNFMTEQVFHAFAAGDGQASLERSRRAATTFLHSRDNCKNAVMENGSGLSWNTRISARCFTETLQWIYRDFRVYADLLGSLPVGGQTGTLKTRFRKNGGDFDARKVRAKTGTLWSRQVVTSLVGFTQAASGEPVVFALIENDQRNDPGQLSVLKDWEDKCVEYIQQLRL